MISKIWKKIKNLIFVDEFDEIYENVTTKTIFVLYCCLGGFCFHENVRKKFRKAWIIFNIVNFLFIYVSCLFYLFNKPTDDYYAWLLPAPVMSGVLSKAVMYAWIYQGKDLLSKLIAFFNSTPEEEVTFASFCTAHLSKRQVEMITGLSCFLFFCTMTTNFGNYVSYENYFIQLYPTYFPYRKTMTLRIVLRVVQCVTLIPENVSFVTLPTLTTTITILIYNRFKLLGLFLRQTSYSVFLQIDEVSNLELAMDENYTLRSLSRIQEMKIKKALALDELVRKVIIVIERHQELYSVAKSYAKYMDYLGTIIHMEIFMASVTLAFFISSITPITFFRQQLIVVAVLCGTLLIWLAFCFIGEMFQKMNEVIASEIYDSPWYLLEPKDRRLVHTYLTIIQRPISIAIYGLYPANLRSFPDTLNTIYSQAQILRTLQLKRQKH